MRFKVLPKAEQPIITFEELSNGEVFTFTGEESTGTFYMKIAQSAMQVTNTSRLIPVLPNTVINHYDSHIVIQGK